MKSPKPLWTVERIAFEKLDEDGEIRRWAAMISDYDPDDENYVPSRFDPWYTVIKRDQQEVLRISTEYYTDSIFEAVKKDEIHPIVGGEWRVYTTKFLGDLYFCSIYGMAESNFNTWNVINRNVEKVQSHKYPGGPSLTLSSQPVIAPETADKGVRKARQTSSSEGKEQ